MERQLVFIPVAQSELAVISGELRLTDRLAHTVTPELLRELDYTEEQTEHAEHAAMVLASVAALARHGERVVLVADVPRHVIRPADDAANGQVWVSELPQDSITCWFCEDPTVDVADAAAAAKGLDIDTAWDFDEVQQLLAGHDLLWNDVEEYRR